MTLLEFINKWQKSILTERAAAQSHFIELCGILGQPAPASDPTGENYTFEKHISKIGGKDSGKKGFADVWQRDHFAWEYKGKHKDLAAAYDQLLQYREQLGNPPLLVVCDLNRFEIHTNFTNTAKQIFKFTLAELGKNELTPTCRLPPLEVLRALFENPKRLRPEQTTAYVTEEAAKNFGRLAQSLQGRGHEPHPISRFLIRMLFCLFAEDVGLLPGKLFTTLIEKTRTRPDDFSKRLALLFEAMAEGGSFGADDIKHFNGGLFTDAIILPLTKDDLMIVAGCAKLDWGSIEPSIFGTLFERSLDPASRAQLGAHYTSREDIEAIVEPVLMAPLRRWAEVKAQASPLAEKRDAASGAQRNRLNLDLGRLLQKFSEELAAVRVLDPACGSGNFLYVALRALLDLEKDVITTALTLDAGGFFPRVGPEQMRGIEMNDYAHELAPITVWIGYIQWLTDNGFGQPSEPILRDIQTIQAGDAILAWDAGGNPVEPAWPEADVVIGNPPFLGGKMLRNGLGDSYVDALFTLYNERVARESDLVIYWFERTRALIASGQVKRAGLLATNSIRGGANRKALARILETGSIFMAWADRPWVLAGAAVRVSMVGFDNGMQTDKVLDGLPTQTIYSDLTGDLNLTAAKQLPENAGLAFMGDTKGGAFDIRGAMAQAMLAAPVNPNGRPNTDVVRPWINGLDVTRRPRGMFIVDFGVAMTESDASFYETPFEYVRQHVKPEREKNNREAYRERWWLHMEPRPALRAAVELLPRFIVTPAVARHRVFTWQENPTLPDHAVFAFARSDDYFFGILHSRVHEVWALSLGTSLEDRPRYTATTTFETFPLPWPPSEEPTDDPKVKAIADAARILVEKRDAWLNPPGAAAADLAKRTLTNLYNMPPAWLESLHKALDAAVLAAYDWPVSLPEGEILERLLALNLSRSLPNSDRLSENNK